MSSITWKHGMPWWDEKLSRDEELDLVRRMRDGDTSARETLIFRHYWLVCSVAKRFRDRGLDLDELQQAGAVGLVEACDRFRDGRVKEADSIRFSTFAYGCIRLEITSAVYKNRHPITVPTASRQRLAAFKLRHKEVMEGVTTQAELRAALGTGKRLAEGVIRSLPMVRVKMGEVIEEQDSTPEAVLEFQDDVAKCQQAIDTLPENERTLIVRLFGIDGDPPATATQLDREFGAYKGWASKVSGKVVARLAVAMS